MLSRKELEDIIARDLPDHELVSVEAPDQVGSADAEGEDIAALRERFLGRGRVAAAPAPRNEHDMIVAVRSKNQAARPKTVIVSGREKRVIGSQG
jgi:hypothetical protein